MQFLKSAGYVFHLERGGGRVVRGFFKTDAQTGERVEVFPFKQRLELCSLGERVWTSRDGRWIAALYRCEEGTAARCPVQFMDAASGDIRWTHEADCTRGYLAWQPDGTLVLEGASESDRVRVDPATQEVSPVGADEVVCTRRESSSSVALDGRRLEVDSLSGTVSIGGALADFSDVVAACSGG